VAEARASGALDDVHLRRRFVDAWIGTQLLRFNGLRQFAALSSGEGPGPAGSLHKVLASEHHRRFGELAVDVHGAAAMLVPDGGDGYAVDRWQRIFFESRSRCISRGTNEIQRDVLAERVLGLPRGR
jgi:alkylation response protein AidB-like acyl-CoA dehydrogenase